MSQNQYEKEGMGEIFWELFENSPEMIFIHDMSPKFIEVNQAVVDVLGYSKKELMKRGPTSLDSPEYRKLVPERIKEILDKGETTFETEHVTKNKKRIPLEIRAKKVVFKGKDAIISYARDISERKAAEVEHDETEKEKDELLSLMEGMIENNGKVVIFALDRKYRYLTFNTAHKDVMKNIWGAEIEIGKCMLDYMTKKKDRDNARKNFDKALKGRSFTVVEEYGKDSSRRWYENIYNPIRNTEGKIIGLTLFLVDVTEEKKRKEDARSIMSAMNDMVWVIDLNGKFIDVNDAAVRRLGYTREELLSFGPDKIDDNLKKSQIIDLVQNMPKDKIQVFETEHTTKKGKRIPIEISSSLITYDGKKEVLSVARDITERKKAKDELSSIKQFLEDIIDSIPDPVFVKDSMHRWTLINDAFCHFIGKKEDELL